MFPFGSNDTGYWTWEDKPCYTGECLYADKTNV
jgi:hypothetical protein